MKNVIEHTNAKDVDAIGKLLNLYSLDNCFVAGGTITSYFTRNEVNDYDIYPKSMKAAADLVGGFFEDGLWCPSITDKSITFVDASGEHYQVIYYREWPDAQSIFETFDFTVCMGAYDYSEKKLFLHEDFMRHNSQRYLDFNPQTSFPLISALRLDKYKKKGYYVSKSQFVKVMMAVSQLDIKNWDEFENHVGGMYGHEYEVPRETEYSLEAAFDYLSQDHVWERKPKDCNVVGFNEDDFLLNLEKTPYLWSKNDDLYFISFDDGLTWKARTDMTGICYPGTYVDIQTAFPPDKKFYKRVKFSGGKYTSFHTPSFEYKLGEVVSSLSPYLYVYETPENCKYRNNCGSVLIELELLDSNDVQMDFKQNHITLKKAKFTRVIEEKNSEQQG